MRRGREEGRPCASWWSRTRGARGGARSAAGGGRGSRSTSRPNGTQGLWMAREGRYDAIVLDILLPGHERLPRVRGAPEGGRLDADPDAHREGRRARRGRGARHRSRRLRDEAVLLRRARRAAPRADPTGARERPAVLEAGDLRFDPASGGPGAGRRGSPHGARDALLEYLLREQGRGRVEDRDPGSRVGRPSTATPTSWRSTSVTCGTSSTGRSDGRRSRRCEAPGYRLAADGG